MKQKDKSFIHSKKSYESKKDLDHFAEGEV